MKTIKVFGLMLFLLVTMNVYSQDATEQGVRFGIKAGINIASVTTKNGTPGVSTSSLVGPTGGFFATIPAGSNFAIQPELLYSMLGAKLTEGNVSAKETLSYLVLPVLAKYNFNNSGFSAYIGPQIGVLLSAKLKVASSSTSVDVKDETKSTDFAGVGGVEYQLPIGLNVSARYQLGFSNLVKEADDGESAKNNAITFTVGYRF